MSAGTITIKTGIRFIQLKRLDIFQRCVHTCRYPHRKHINETPGLTKYGGKTNITVLPGTGIGPEIMKSTMEVLDAAEAPLSYEVLTISHEHQDEDFAHILTSIKRNRIAIKGNIETKSKDPLVGSRNILLRKLLDLFVYILPMKSFPGLNARKIDLVFIRQNTEGEYLMLEHEPTPGSVESLKVLSRYNLDRIAEYTYKYATAHGRKLVTVIHTSSIHSLTEGLFLESALKFAEKYPDVQTVVKEASRATIELMTKPENFDVLLATNLNGAMLGNMLNGVLGGPALSAGTNLGGNGIAVFEPGVRNKGSGIVNRGIANPTAMLMAASSLLRHIGQGKTAQIIDGAIYNTIVHDRVHTPELGGKATTREITDNIIGHVKQLLSDSRSGARVAQNKHKRWAVTGTPETKTSGGGGEGSSSCST